MRHKAVLFLAVVAAIKAASIDRNIRRELSPREAYADGKLTLKGALKLNALLDLHPSLITGVSGSLCLRT